MDVLYGEGLFAACGGEFTDIGAWEGEPAVRVRFAGHLGVLEGDGVLLPDEHDEMHALRWFLADRKARLAFTGGA